MTRPLTTAALAFALLTAAPFASAAVDPGPTGPGSYRYWGMPRSAAEVDKGKFGNIRWTSRMRGGHGNQICIWLGVSGPAGITSGRSCRADLSPPTNDWLPIQGASVDIGKPYAARLDVTSAKVRSVKLLIGPKPLIWRRVETQGITRAQAQRGHLPRDFRFYVIHRRTEFCVKRVVAFDRSGSKIDDFPTPCEL